MLRYLLVPALLVASSPSDADTCICNHAPPTRAPTTSKACKLVVLDFDGATKLADASRNVFMKAMSKYELVPPKQWDTAYGQQSDLRGPRRWQDAAKQSGVKAVIEGWVEDDAGRYTMMLRVRDATTGREVDMVSARIDDKGVAQNPAHLIEQVDEVLAWVDCAQPARQGLR
jgi:hypothetical protein